jgi:hypothetical protein
MKNRLKGRGHQMKISLKLYEISTFVASTNGFKFLFKRKTNKKFLLASLETFTNSNNFSENHIIFLLWLSFTFTDRLPTVYVFVHGHQLSDNFQIHMRLSKQLSESQAIICKPEQGPEVVF